MSMASFGVSQQKGIVFFSKIIMTSGGCKRIIAAGELVTFYVKPGVKKRKKQDPPAGGSNAPVFINYIVFMSFLFDLSEVGFVLS